MTISPYADATMNNETDDQDWAWIALAAAIRNVVTFLELSAAAQRGNRDATALLPGAHATLSGMENELLPTAPGLGGGGETPPAANSALGGAAEYELDDIAPETFIRRRPSAIA